MTSFRPPMCFPGSASGTALYFLNLIAFFYCVDGVEIKGTATTLSSSEASMVLVNLGTDVRTTGLHKGLLIRRL